MLLILIIQQILLSEKILSWQCNLSFVLYVNKCKNFNIVRHFLYRKKTLFKVTFIKQKQFNSGLLLVHKIILKKYIS